MTFGGHAGIGWIIRRGHSPGNYVYRAATDAMLDNDR
jgi:hypothetical protein